MTRDDLIDLASGNPGALAFIGESYKINRFRAELACQRMLRGGIKGSHLYMLWNDCCDCDTEKAMKIMLTKDLEDIKKHINYGKGRGYAFE